jgi:acetamidase/formamidase
VVLTFAVHPGGESWTGPRARTAEGYVTLGFGDTLDDAGEMALDAMLDHLGNAFGLERPEALALASVSVDLRVTQVVNQRVGVHAVLPDGIVNRSAG